MRVLPADPWLDGTGYSVRVDLIDTQRRIEEDVSHSEGHES